MASAVDFASCIILPEEFAFGCVACASIGATYDVFGAGEAFAVSVSTPMHAVANAIGRV